MDNKMTEISNASEASASDCISRITQVVTEKDQKMMENEAWIACMKAELNRLDTAANDFNVKHFKLELENATLEKQAKELDTSIDIKRESLIMKSNMVVALMQEKLRLEKELEEIAHRSTVTYQDYLEKYERAKNLYELHHPLAKRLKEIRSENLKQEACYDVLQQELIKQKKTFKEYLDNKRQAFNSTIIDFAKNILTYQNCRNLSSQIEQGEKLQIKLTQQLCELEIKAVQKQKEIERQQFEQIKNIGNSSNFKLPLLKSFQTKFVSKETTISKVNESVPHVVPNIGLKTEEMLQQIRTRWEKRQQLAANNINTVSFIAQKTPLLSSSLKENCYGQLLKTISSTSLVTENSRSLVGQKRPLLSSSSKQNCYGKILKTLSSNSLVDENKYSLAAKQDSKINIISNHVVKTPTLHLAQEQINEKLKGTNVQVAVPKSVISDTQRKKVATVSPENKENIDQVFIQHLKAQHFSDVPQNYQMEYVTSQLQPWQMDKRLPTHKSDFNKISIKPPENYYTKNAHENVQNNYEIPPQIILSQNPTAYNSQTNSLQSQNHNQYEFTQTTMSSYPNTNYPTQTQGSHIIVNNTTGNNQSAAYSQKYVELQDSLTKNWQKQLNPSQVNPNSTVETSPFFSKQTSMKRETLNSKFALQMAIPVNNANQTDLDEYPEENCSFNSNLSYQLSPDRPVDQNDLENSTPTTSGFIMGHSQNTPPGENKLNFSSKKFFKFP